MCEIAGRVDVTIARADGDTIARADGGVVSQVLEQMEASFAGVSSSSSPPITWVVGVAGATALSRFSTCSQCNVLRLYGTSHCTICNACCVGLDHHCPWTGKCIGKGNLTPFFVFVYSLGIHIALIITSTIALFATGKYIEEMMFVFH